MSGSGLRQALRDLGVSRAVAFGGLARVCLAGFSAATLLLVARLFDPRLQGYYYTFLSLLNLQVFAELGLTGVLISLASQHWAHLEVGPDGRPRGAPDSLSRLRSLSRLASRWFAASGVLVAAGLAAGGTLFLAREPGPEGWRSPWIVLSLLGGVKVALLPYAALLEGCNRVVLVNAYRLGVSAAGGAAGVAALVLGQGLWAPVWALAADTAWTAVFLLGRPRRFLAGLLSRPEGPVLRWRTDVWPLQGRIALSWVSGFFAFSAFTPLLFEFQGPVLAGRWGLTWSVFSLGPGIASLWVTTRAPQYGIWIERREFDLLDRDFLRRATISTALSAALGAAVWMGIVVLGRLGSPLAERALSPGPAAMIGLGAALMHAMNVQGVYIRAHRREPYTALSIVQALLTVGASAVLGPRYGAEGMAAAYLAVVALVALPVGTWITLRCRREWRDL